MRLGRAGLDAIDQLLAFDPGHRGIASFFLPGAAGAAAGALRGARRVLLVTGFCVPPGLPETDGPPGAAVLGRALRRLGARVRYVTDEPVVAPLAAVLEALDEPADITVYDGGATALLARERPTHLVAIERPGRARSGDCLSARGESVAPWNSALDQLFLPALDSGKAGLRRGGPGPGAAAHRAGTSRAPVGDRRGMVARAAGAPRASTGRLRAARSATASSPQIARAPGTTTIAIGDGGNEIGMGNVRARLARMNPLMARIASVVRVDHLVVAGTSNWGAYGVVAALERLAGRPLLHAPADERRLVEACVKAGAVDGIVRHREPTVDGLSLDTHAAFVELLRHAV